MKSALLIFFLRCLSLLPLGLVRKLGILLGGLSWAFSSRMADTTRINLALCYPDMPESKRLLLARDSIYNTFQTVTETGPVWLWPEEKILDRILEVEGLELLQDAASAGNGVVVMAPHLGNWEVFGLYLNVCGCGQTSNLYQPPRDRKLDELIYKARGRTGAVMVPTDAKGVTLLLKALKRGELVGILPDQVPPETGGEYAPFFGVDVLTMTLVSRLLQKTGAKAVLGYAARISKEGKAGWKIIFRKPGDEIYAEHMPTSLKAMNHCIELAVNEIPEQYQWEYKRFKRVAPGTERPY